jgi:hypothetical protein
MVDSLAKDVEKEKMKAIGTRNLLKSVAKQREAEQQKLQVSRPWTQIIPCTILKLLDKMIITADPSGYLCILLVISFFRH